MRDMRHAGRGAPALALPGAPHATLRARPPPLGARMSTRSIGVEGTTAGSLSGADAAVDRQIFAIAGPALLGLCIDPLSTLVDTAFAARIGATELAALVAAAAPPPLPTLAGRTGQPEPASAEVSVSSLLLSFAIGVPLALALALGAPAILSLASIGIAALNCA
ncbi:hypothetical protein T492DRAFT_888708, partial [Pavlovales sp. CCMP2436]